jgi:acid stress-induced BolA-like protein IbaG/YrbA
VNAELLKSIIANSIDCQHLHLEGDGRHWFATLVSSQFEGLSRIRRHQMVYASLGQKIHTDEVHALSMKTYSPSEWELSQQHPTSNKQG